MYKEKQIVEGVSLSVSDCGDVICRRAACSTLKPLDAVFQPICLLIHYRKKVMAHTTASHVKNWPACPFCNQGPTSVTYFLMKSFCRSPPHLSDVLSWSVGGRCSCSQSWLTLQAPKNPAEICFFSSFCLLIPGRRQICRPSSLIPPERFLNFLLLILITDVVFYLRCYILLYLSLNHWKWGFSCVSWGFKTNQMNLRRSFGNAGAS